MSLVSVSDYEQKAIDILPRNALDYYRSGSDNQVTLQLNKTAFQRLRIRPRHLRDVSNRSTSTKVFEFNSSMPIGIAPTAMHKMAHDDGEIATAKAAGKLGTIFILSTLSTTSIEDVARHAPDTHKWFQLYISKDRELTKSMVRRAETNNFKALVLTVDAPMFGIRRADVRNKFQLPSHLQLENFMGNGIVNSDGGSGINEYVKKQFDSSITWKDVKWLVGFTKLPVILKGILTKEDALLAVETGCKGIIVSNHGARQLDTVAASIEALPEVVRAAGDKLVVMLDGGVTQGTDVFKAIALGAKMVFLGRPILWGLANGGQEGVENVLKIVHNEFDTALALSGTTTVNDITKEYVIHERELSKL
ncbi:peroxisomal (S)-2-hydroxy-acid oxidase GLO3-like [Bradysia coprophila]|uniref:peroxisomal (S)-2-hydroxy-acid oxidase GLO3-like n=1 Tax=Bradysia coprophila TaxID=38358 RepID=UPI00187DCD60|nr:peroxisomal (S)-2-hydroxy-acid oxidase GLO3-like [Bradysia coprophila]